MEREVRYCTSSDGTRIAYTVRGNGTPLLFALPNPTSIEIDEDIPEVAAFFDDLLPGRMLIRYDMRGTGASDREAGTLSAEAQATDITAVAQALGLQRFSMFAGPFTPAHAAAIFAATHPEFVERLILWAIIPTIAPKQGPVADAERLLTKENWRGASRLTGDAIAPQGSEDLKKAITRVARHSLSAEAFLRHGAVISDISAVLPLVTVPTLVLNCRNDRQFPMDESRRVAASIPGARMVTIEGNSAFFFVHGRQLTSVIADFLGGAAPDDQGAPQVSAQPFRTVLFTDLVGHTEMMSRLGDDRGRDVLREHERITRETLKANGGTEVKTMGDGFMASFGSVTKAVECAVALQRAIEEHNRGVEGTASSASTGALSVRVGLNAGEPIEEDGDLFGATVILASRIAAKAEGGEILVADTVRGLCSGKGFTFADRGEFAAKGFVEPVRVYEVRWRE